MKQQKPKKTLSNSSYLTLKEHYESCFAQYGDSHKGVDWPNKKEMIRRYEIMLGLLPAQRDKPTSLLDVGCGTAGLLKYIIQNNLSYIHYEGVDISENFISFCTNTYPSYSFFCGDMLRQPIDRRWDYLMGNGVFTEKRALSYTAMYSFFKDMIMLFKKYSRKGFAFNVMSKHVDWERSDLFHVPFDTMAHFLTQHIGRHFIFRNDYGLYEYTVYVYHSPNR